MTATKEATVTDNTYNLRNGASTRAKREPEGSLCKCEKLTDKHTPKSSRIWGKRRFDEFQSCLALSAM